MPTGNPISGEELRICRELLNRVDGWTSKVSLKKIKLYPDLWDNVLAICGSKERVANVCSRLRREEGKTTKRKNNPNPSAETPNTLDPHQPQKHNNKLVFCPCCATFVDSHTQNYCTVCGLHLKALRIALA